MISGYHNFFSIYYIELIKNFKIYRLFREIYFYLKKHGLKNLIQNLKYLIFYLLPVVLQNSISKRRYSSINKKFFEDYKNNEVNKLLYKPKDLNESMVQHVKHKLEHMLRWDDLHSMAFSIESRVPFLDFRLVEAVLKTPANQKINDGETKHILRQSLKDILPKKITDNYKCIW